MRICRRDFGRFLAGASAARLLALPNRPKLLVLLVLGEFRPEYLDSVWTQLSPGGFRRILEKGAYFPDCRHLASTFSTTTLASLATGAWPSQHGIVADSWYDPITHNRQRASEEMLLATTIGSQIAAEPRARLAVIAIEERHAALFAGTPDAYLYWMDEAGQFATRGDVPPWLANYNNQRGSEQARNQKWMALGARPDAPPLRVLKYSPEHPGEFVTLYKASPFAQSAEIDLAAELITREGMGQGNTFDAVGVVLDAATRLGYETGSNSPLIQQMVLQLDRRLEGLLAFLAKTPGENAFDLVIVGAHGAPPEPEAESRPRMAVKSEQIAQTVERAVAKLGARVEKYIYPFLYLDTSAFRDPEPLRLAAAQAALQHPAVAGYFTAGGACSTFDGWDRRYRNSFHPTRSGDVMLSYRAEYVEDYGQNRGVSYGSLYNYDVRVPLCFYGPQFRPGVFESPVESVDVAPTLARALGVATPSSSTGRVLGEALVG